MPLSNDFTFNPEKTVLKNIESLQKLIRSPKFTDENTYKTQDRKEAFTALFAMRMAVNATRGEKSSLKANVTQAQYDAALKKLKESPSFGLFLEKQGDQALQRKLTEGRTHGGSAEDAFQDYLMEADKLPADPPLRYMPKANARIEKLQTKLETLPGDGEEAAAIYGEIFRIRRGVGAVRGKGSSLDLQVDPTKLGDVPDIGACDAFKEFVREQGAALKTTALKGHSGEAEEKFRDHVLNMDHIPANTPAAYMPQALERTEALVKKMKEPGFSYANGDRKLTVFAELMGTRQAVKAVRGKKSSLEKPIDPAALEAAVNQWKNCESFRRFVTEEDPEAAREAAATGHGGALGDKFREHVLNLDHLAADVPADYMPQGLERVEALQKKFKSDDYVLYDEERKLTLYAELMATRSAVGAVRGKKSSLEKPIDPAALNREVNSFKACEAFQSYIRDHDAEARRAAAAGHGGALEEGFARHVLNLDSLPQGIPGHRMKPGDELTLGDMTVQAYDSTDLGVSYYVELQGRSIFHAGDLNLWHWREESTVREIKQAEEDFYDAVEPIRGLNIDLCMFPLDPRQGGLFDAGINHFVMSVKPRVVIPMHWQQRAEVPLNYARRGRTRYTEILALTKPRERADLTFGEDELQIHVHTPVSGLFEEKKEPEIPEERNDDPFTDTDLPVNVQ